MTEIIKIIASYGIILPIILVAYVFIRLGSKRERIELISIIVAGGVLSLVLARIGSHLVYDPRPFVTGHFTPLISHANDNGFPSDHTLLGSFLGFVLLHYRRWLGVGTLLIAAVIGAARVAAGVHHILDIIGSFVITALAMLVVMGVIQLLNRRDKRSSVSGS